MHESMIPAEILARVVERRGRRHINERLEAATCALVVIDLQDGFMLPGVPLEVAAARAIVPNVNRLAAAFRAAGGRVVWVRMNVEGERDSWSAFFRRFPAEVAERQLVALAPGGVGYPLYKELDVLAGDDVIDKKRYSAFIAGSSPIDGLLRTAGIDTIVVTGTLTNVCCESTARDAMMLNYNVVLVSDANATWTDEQHNATLTTMVQNFGDVMTTDEVLERLVPAKVPARA
jgi:ureidoacrylate peracid hydrolase